MKDVLAVIAAVFSGIIAIIVAIAVWAVGIILTVGVIVGAFYLVFKLFGIDIEGFTA